jgi:hypothetical protein
MATRVVSLRHASCAAPAGVVAVRRVRAAAAAMPHRTAAAAAALQSAPRARGRLAASQRAHGLQVRAAQQQPNESDGGSAAAVETQRYKFGSVDVEMPLAAVQQMPLPLQAAVVAAIFGALGLGTWASCTFVGPAIQSAAPGFMAFSRATWPLLGATFMAAGVAHFTAHDAFATMMPTRCAGVSAHVANQPLFLCLWHC